MLFGVVDKDRCWCQHRLLTGKKDVVGRVSDMFDLTTLADEEPDSRNSLHSMSIFREERNFPKPNKRHSRASIFRSTYDTTPIQAIISEDNSPKQVQDRTSTKPDASSGFVAALSSKVIHSASKVFATDMVGSDSQA